MPAFILKDPKAAGMEMGWYSCPLIQQCASFLHDDQPVIVEGYYDTR